MTNAYGSISHSLVEFALQRHHAPSKIRNLILDYYNGCYKWNQLEKRIITDCAICVTIFVLAMNMVTKSAEVKCRGSRHETTFSPGLMDDLNIIASSVPGTRWILQGLGKLITWARLSFPARWPGLPHSLRSVGLYGSSNILQLPFGGLKEGSWCHGQGIHSYTEAWGTPKQQVQGVKSGRAGSGEQLRHLSWQSLG